MEVVVPYDGLDPKTRLEPVLEDRERHELGRACLEGVLAAVEGAGGDPHVLATADVPVDAPVTVDDRPLSPAVNAILADRSDPVGLVVADLPLASVESLERLFSATGQVVLVPGRGGGTNALVVKEPDFRVDFHGSSFLDHRRAATALGVEPTVVDSHRLSTDIDEPADLVEVLVHGRGPARDFLEECGFGLSDRGGRVSLHRRGDPVDG